MLRDGETVENLKAYAGISEILIGSEPDAVIRNITFEGLTFCNTTWMRPERRGGYFTRQAGFYVLPDIFQDDLNYWQRPEAAIKLYKTDGVRFINNEFVNLGNSAIDLEQAKNAVISGNLFTAVGGTSIVLGGFAPDIYHSYNENITTDNCEISNNVIHDICTNSQSSCGITVGYSRNINILNNTIYNPPYSGISQGWG